MRWPRLRKAVEASAAYAACVLLSLRARLKCGVLSLGPWLRRAVAVLALVRV